MVSSYRNLEGASSSITAEPCVLFEDNHVIGVFKPHRWPVQGDETGDLSLLDWTREWIRKEKGKTGNVFLGLVHRLDRPASGVVVFGKTSKGASRLSEQFRERTVTKVYWALVQGKPAKQGHVTSGLKVQGRNPVVESEDGVLSSLDYKVVQTKDGVSLVEVNLLTGRKHQIRAQLSGLGYPILGDGKYGSKIPYQKGAVALVAQSLTFRKATGEEEVTVQVPPELNSIEKFFRVSQ